SKIFTTFDASNAWQITQDLYDIYCLPQLIQKEIAAKGWNKNEIDIVNKAFTQSDLRWLDFINSAEDFYEKGPGKNINGIAVSIAAPLLSEFLSCVEKEIEHPNTLDAKLNFAHAETISPFATLLEIPQASHASASVFDYAKNWHADQIIPMASNIQWILYSNGKSYLVKVLLNEKEAALPVSTTTFPYYHWDDVSNFYTNKLKSLGIDENTNLHDYLLNIKN
ncbi:MAG TPA: histidine phosphatase family protein, partial [Arachidicoccus sp.]